MTGTFTPSDSALLLMARQIGTLQLIKNIPDGRAGIVNASNDVNLKQAAEKTRRRNLIMAGVTTDVHLVHRAISACREGHQVQAVKDASGSPFNLSEDSSRRRMEREGVVLTATNTLMAELAQDRSRPEGGQPPGILFREVPPKIKEPPRFRIRRPA
ncbi:MAG TPA: isochorismatase family protein [Gemmatimonadaceae bacterium]|nr:isochorismatase family protein [Gemmatimonadaceae bacterium]